MREVYVITDYKPLVAILNKDVANIVAAHFAMNTPVQVHIIYKTGPDMYIAV